MSHSLAARCRVLSCGVGLCLVWLSPRLTSGGLVLTTESDIALMAPYDPSGLSIESELAVANCAPCAGSAGGPDETRTIERFVLRGPVPDHPTRLGGATPYGVDDVLATLTLPDPLTTDAGSDEDSDDSHGERACRLVFSDPRPTGAEKSATGRAEHVPPMPVRPLTLALGVLWLVSLCRRLVVREPAGSTHEASTHEGSTGHVPYDYSLLETMLPAIGSERDEFSATAGAVLAGAVPSQPAAGVRGANTNASQRCLERQMR